MIKAQYDAGYVDVEITGNGGEIAKELCSILDRLSDNSDTKLIVIAAISDHIIHLRESE